MPWHLEPLADTARHYTEGGGYEEHRDYGTAVTVTWQGPDECFLLGMRGDEVSRADFRDLRDALMARGMKRAWAIRDNERIVMFCADRECRAFGEGPLPACPDATCRFQSHAAAG